MRLRLDGTRVHVWKPNAYGDQDVQDESLESWPLPSELRPLSLKSNAAANGVDLEAKTVAGGNLIKCRFDSVGSSIKGNVELSCRENQGFRRRRFQQNECPIYYTTLYYTSRPGEDTTHTRDIIGKTELYHRRFQVLPVSSYSLPVSTPNTIHHSCLTACLPA